MASSGQIISMMGPCGGKDGTVKDMDITGITRIVKISVLHHEVIGGITVHFERNGREENTGIWGSKEQSARQSEFNLQPSEYIMSVSGHLENFKLANTSEHYVVRSLTFKTNLGTYGPYGKEKGRPFGLPALGGEIIGFHGSSGQWLDSIGVYVKARNAAPGGTDLLDGLKEEKLNLKLFLHQHWAGPRKNQDIAVNSNLGDKFGELAINDWALLDGLDQDAKLVARGEGLHAQASLNKRRWYCSFSIVFEDDKWKGSSLEVRGWYEDESPSLEWAIVGGTGQFALAQGVIFGKKQSNDSNSRIVELSIHALYRPVKNPNLAKIAGE